MHWKIERDYFYSGLEPASLEEAGFFFDSSTENVDISATLDVMSTPIDFIKYNSERKQAIIVGTGCFAPIHTGHLQTMQSARTRLLEAGYDDVYGFIAPDHDEYIGTKVKDAYLIDERIQTIHQMIKDIDWLRIDMWPGLFCNGSINFTDVVYRLQAYINKHVGNIKVFLVVGGDNARFALTFKNIGGCVIVNRPGYEDRMLKYSHLVDNVNIFAANGNCDECSSRIRTLERKEFKPANLYLRIENNFAMVEKLKPFYNSIKPIRAITQRMMLDKMRKENPLKVISLDSLIKTDYNLEISRAYDYMGINKIGYVARPEADSLEEQISRIPKGTYDLYDDDICTGGTMKFAKELLAQNGIEINTCFSFITSKEGDEVLDERDFFVGPNCGLVIKNKDKYVRRPYALPYVLPSIRASVENSLTFSKNLVEFKKI